MPPYTDRLLSLPEYPLSGIPEKKRDLIARGVDVSGATVAISDATGVAFYDATDTANPRLLGVQPTGGVAWDGSFGARNLYVANEQGLVVIENVPAEVCSICGDILLTPDTVRRMEEILREAREPDRMAPVYEYARW